VRRLGQRCYPLLRSSGPYTVGLHPCNVVRTGRNGWRSWRNFGIGGHSVGRAARTEPAPYPWRLGETGWSASPCEGAGGRRRRSSAGSMAASRSSWRWASGWGARWSCIPAMPSRVRAMIDAPGSGGKVVFHCFRRARGDGGIDERGGYGSFTGVSP